MDRVQATGKIRKRKAESQDNERLTKRLSLLNIERNGQKLYVPVERPPSRDASSKAKPSTQIPQDDSMQLDDTKHKVYIYDLDAELSDSESSDDGKLIFLQDIDKHLRESRIPPSMLVNSEGQLSGQTQLVLYGIPSSLTVPEEQDSVRRAIIETRARARAKQDEKQNADTLIAQTASTRKAWEALDWSKSMIDGNTGNVRKNLTNGGGPRTATPPVQVMDDEPTALDNQEILENDPDAMDLG